MRFGVYQTNCFLRISSVVLVSHDLPWVKISPLYGGRSPYLTRYDSGFIGPCQATQQVLDILDLRDYISFAVSCKATGDIYILELIFTCDYW